MAVTAADLAAFIGTSDQDTPMVEAALAAATVIVDDVFEQAYREVPEVVRDRVVTEVGAEMYRRKDSPSGSSQYAQYDGGAAPVRAPRDPLTAVWPIIRPYVLAF